MSDLQLIGTVLGAASFGAIVTVVAQLAAALRSQSRELAHASRRVADLADLLAPSAIHMKRIMALLEDSEPDLRRVQQSVHRLSKGSVELADHFARVNGWVGVAAPLLVAAFEAWAGRASGEASEPAPARPRTDPVAAVANDDAGRATSTSAGRRKASACAASEGVPSVDA